MSGDADDRTRKSGARERRVLLFHKIFRARAEGAVHSCNFEQVER